MRAFLFSSVALLCLLLAGCAENDGWFIDEGPVQIGCRATTHQTDKASPELPAARIEREANLRLGFPWWIHDTDKNTQITVNGLILSPLLDVAPETLNGVALSGIFVHDTVNGVVISPLFNITRQTNGLTLSCWNWSSNQATVQAGLINFCEFMRAPGDVIWQTGVVNDAGSSRVQLGVFNNSWIEAWLQLGLVNTTSGPDKHFDPDKGGQSFVQIGLYNDVRKGMQLGLLNRNKNGWLWQYFPLINFSKDEK